MTRSYREILNNSVAPDDTSPEAREVYWRRLSEMTPAERIDVGVALWQAGDALQRAAIRHMNPGIDEDELLFRLAVCRFGLELAQKVYRSRAVPLDASGSEQQESRA